MPQKVRTTTTAEKNNKQKVENKQPRIRAFDFARGIAIVVMVMIHCIVFLSDPDRDYALWELIANTIICLLAAPVFTFIMGIMISFSSKNSTKSLLIRGLTLLGIGYILNLFRGTIPVDIVEWFDWDGATGENPWLYLLEEDILTYAGLSFLVIALFKRVVPWVAGLAIAGVAVIFISPFVWETGFARIPVIDYVLSLFFGGHIYNFFPLFPWIAFPLIGMFYGSVLKASTNKKVFFTRSFYLGLAIVLSSVIVLFFDKTDIVVRWYEGEFRQGMLPPLVAIIFLGFQLVWLSITYYITTTTKENKITETLYFWSNNVTWFYIVQWLIIGWLCIFLPYLSWYWIIVTIVGVAFVTDRVCHLLIGRVPKF